MANMQQYMSRAIMAGMVAWLCLVWNVARGDEPLSDAKPFAEAHVILQVSQNDNARFRLAMDVASNLSAHYGGQDMVDIELIAFGGGIGFLFAADNPNRERVENLMAHGVRFFACGNTLDTIERRDKKRPELIPSVEVVQTGVAFMLDEVRRGYVHIQP